VGVLLGWGGGHPEIHHVSITISLLVLQAVRNERAPWLNGQMTSIEESDGCRFKSNKFHCENHTKRR
jgi:hypothetical protein